MREWLTVIIVLLIIGVLLDGTRRMRQSRRSAIKMSRRVNQYDNVQSDSNEEPETYGSELPNGGARVVTVRAPDDAQQRNSKIKQTVQANSSRAGRSRRLPEQVALNLDEAVPMLMESVGENKNAAQSHEAKRATTNAPRRAESQHSLFDDPLIDDVADADERGRIEPRISSDFDSPPSAAVMDSDSQHTEAESGKSENFDDNDGDFGIQVGIDSGRPAPESYNDESADMDVSMDDVKAYADDVESKGGDSHYVEPEVVLVINVMAPKGVKFSGAALLDVVLAEGMRYGSMNIFHRHVGDRGEGSSLYSMANIVVPGTFDLSTMKTLVTPGVSLFMALPLEHDDNDAAPNSLQAFELMLRTAKAIAQSLNGELKDENRSVLTTQTVEHYRQRIRDFERKQLSRAPA